MPRVIDSPEQFTSIGENIHATRVVLRNGRKAKTLDDGTEMVPFKGNSGEDRLLTGPEAGQTGRPSSQSPTIRLNSSGRSWLGRCPVAGTSA